MKPEVIQTAQGYYWRNPGDIKWRGPYKSKTAAMLFSRIPSIFRTTIRAALEQSNEA